MEFQVGDRVVHWSHGPGEIIQISEKQLANQTLTYYVVQIGTMTVWVPKNGEEPGSLRPPTPAAEFETLFAILRSPGEPLSADRLERKNQLMEQMRDGSLASICRVVRDLAFFKRSRKMSDIDTTIFERAQKFLLYEWELALAVPFQKAERDMKQMLGEDAAL